MSCLRDRPATVAGAPDGRLSEIEQMSKQASGGLEEVSHCPDTVLAWVIY